jgi:hypothetical protein
MLAICQNGGTATAEQRPTTSEESPQASAQLRVLSARLEALEKKIASGGFAVAPAKTPTVSAVKTTRIAAAVGAQKNASVHQPVVGGNGAFTPTREAEGIWRRVLDALQKNPEQKVIYACVSKGTAGGMTAERFCVQFQSQFLANRLNQPDYRNVIEGYIAEFSGSPLGLVVEVGAPSAPQEKPKAAPPKKKTAAEMVAELPPEARTEVKKAMDIFGPDAKIVPMPEKDTHPSAQKKSDPNDEAPPITDEDFKGLDDTYVPPEEDI